MQWRVVEKVHDKSGQVHGIHQINIINSTPRNKLHLYIALKLMYRTIEISNEPIVFQLSIAAIEAHMKYQTEECN